MKKPTKEQVIKDLVILRHYSDVIEHHLSRGELMAAAVTSASLRGIAVNLEKDINKILEEAQRQKIKPSNINIG